MSEPIRAYKRINGEGLLLKLRVSLPDRPGSLAGFASLLASAGGNIEFFHYDRSVDSTRIAVEAEFDSADGLDALMKQIASEGYAAASDEEPSLTTAEGVFEISVKLEDRPGSLAEFAAVLKSHEANITYMLYDDEITPDSADVAMAAPSPPEIDTILDALNQRGYHYRVLYRGADGDGEVKRAIGLKLTERFFIRLKAILGAEDAGDVRSLVRSSGELYRDLVGFYEEAGRDLDASEVFEKVLAMASRARGQVGDRFVAQWMEPLACQGVTVEGIRLPTSENVYLLSREGGELALIDAGHGIYYEDFKRALRERGHKPSAVRRVFVTHPDTDHIGMAGRFEAENGAEIWMHRGGRDVMESLNRAHGTSGRLFELNKYYTRLSIRITGCAFPEHPAYWAAEEGHHVAFGGFKIIGRFEFGPLEFEVIESRGGHAPGLVFYLCRACGWVFTSDYLINPATLMPRDREQLGIYKYLLTNPNTDPALYNEESGALRSALAALAGQRKAPVTVLPGHGGHYIL